jgi:hypothetical protein
LGFGFAEDALAADPAHEIGALGRGHASPAGFVCAVLLLGDRVAAFGAGGHDLMFRWRCTDCLLTPSAAAIALSR